MAEKLWDLANLITGFGVVQTLTMTYAMLKGDVRISGRREHRIVYAGTGFFAALYIIAIVACGWVGKSFDADDHSLVWRWVTIGRVVAVLLFMGVTVAATYAHQQERAPAGS